MGKFSDLYAAVKRLDIADVRRLIENGVDINCRDSMRRTVLHHAVELSNVDVSFIKNLVDLGADVSARDILRRTPLHYVFPKDFYDTISRFFDSQYQSSPVQPQTHSIAFDEKRFYHIVSKLDALLKLGADINATFDLITSLHRAVRLAKNPAVKVLARFSSLANNTGIYNFTALLLSLVYENSIITKEILKHGGDVGMAFEILTPSHDAVVRHHTCMVGLLATSGVSINWSRYEGMHPLALAVCLNKPGINSVKALVDAGANLNIGFRKVTAVYDAVRSRDYNMIKTLGKLEADMNKESTENIQPLHLAIANERQDIINYFASKGADMTLQCSNWVAPLHDAVTHGDTQIVRLLSKFKANMNRTRNEGMSSLAYALHQERPCPKTVKALIDAGVDPNIGYREVTPLHDAVELDNMEMVESLSKCKVDMNSGAREGLKPIYQATLSGMKDAVRHLARHGADINAGYSSWIRPIHLAVRMDNTHMVQRLIAAGANPRGWCSKDTGIVPLYNAIHTGQNDMLRHLIECGADINVTIRRNVSFLHDAAEHANTDMVMLLLGYQREAVRPIADVTLLHASVNDDNIEATEILLQNGIKRYPPLGLVYPPRQVLLEDDGKQGILAVIDGVSCQDRSSRPLHRAATLGLIDQARTLLIYGSDVYEHDNSCKMILQGLPLANIVNYQTIFEAATAKTIVGEGQPSDITRNADVETVLHTPGIGDVRYIPYINSAEIFDRVHKHFQTLPCWCTHFSGGQLTRIGSAGEGTKVGLPDEMDLLLTMEMQPNVHVTDKRHDYVQCEYHWKNGKGVAADQIMWSSEFHKDFASETRKAFSYLQWSHDKKIQLINQSAPHVRRQDRKACSPVTVLYKDWNTTFRVSIDLVPCLRVKDWPKGAVNRTWLMDHEELLRRGYVIVPKPPHMESDLAKMYSEEELCSLWKVSFPHLETEHMQRLEQRVKDVYVTAKALRNPDVCRILIRDKGLTKKTDKYISSYLLKMCFFKNVECFLQSDMSLVEMVYKVYSDVEQGLQQGFIPLFFMPKVCAFAGRKMDVPKCAKVAGIMRMFVRALYLRECMTDPHDIMDDENTEVVVDIYRRKPSSVYKLYNID